MTSGERNPERRGVYQQIFANVRGIEELRGAIAQAVRELRAAMEKDDNSAVTMAHIRNLDDVDPGSLARAYALAERSCIYWPAPGQIRELAGHSEGDEAQSALEWTLGYLEAHGIEGRAKGGAVAFGEDGAGRRVMLAVEPLVEAPEIPVRIRKTLAALGSGQARRGLFYLSQHPLVKAETNGGPAHGGWDEAPGGESPTKTAERIERQWARCYRQALREQIPSQTASRRTQ